jgi:hypothetical protein
MNTLNTATTMSTINTLRSETEESIKTKGQIKSIDIIQEIKKLVKDLGEKERFKIAKEHLLNALSYKAPRLDTYS